MWFPRLQGELLRFFDFQIFRFSDFLPPPYVHCKVHACTMQGDERGKREIGERPKRPHSNNDLARCMYLILVTYLLRVTGKTGRGDSRQWGPGRLDSIRWLFFLSLTRILHRESIVVLKFGNVTRADLESVLFLFSRPRLLECY